MATLANTVMKLAVPTDIEIIDCATPAPHSPPSGPFDFSRFDFDKDKADKLDGHHRIIKRKNAVDADDHHPDSKKRKAEHEENQYQEFQAILAARNIVIFLTLAKDAIPDCVTYIRDRLPRFVDATEEVRDKLFTQTLNLQLQVNSAIDLFRQIDHPIFQREIQSIDQQQLNLHAIHLNANSETIEDKSHPQYKSPFFNDNYGFTTIAKAVFYACSALDFLPKATKHPFAPIFQQHAQQTLKSIARNAMYLYIAFADYLETPYDEQYRKRVSFTRTWEDRKIRPYYFPPLPFKINPDVRLDFAWGLAHQRFDPLLLSSTELQHRLDFVIFLLKNQQIYDHLPIDIKDEYTSAKAFFPNLANL